MNFYRVQEMNETETSDDMKLKQVAGDMVRSASKDPKLSNTEFMKYVAGLATGGKVDEWSEEFLQKVGYIIISYYFVSTDVYNGIYRSCYFFVKV